ncbi:MAG: hypothetical protein V2I43_04760 [Parvularcula sp.]|nr:hypothetical protein [Parvularcula sp.]
MSRAHSRLEGINIMTVHNPPFPHQREIDLPCPHAVRVGRLRRVFGLSEVHANVVDELHYGGSFGGDR